MLNATTAAAAPIQSTPPAPGFDGKGGGAIRLAAGGRSTGWAKTVGCKTVSASTWVAGA